MVTKEFEITLINIILVEVLHSASSVKTEMSSMGQTVEELASTHLRILARDYEFSSEIKQK